MFVYSCRIADHSFSKEKLLKISFSSAEILSLRDMVTSSCLPWWFLHYLLLHQVFQVTSQLILSFSIIGWRSFKYLAGQPSALEDFKQISTGYLNFPSAVCFSSDLSQYSCLICLGIPFLKWEDSAAIRLFADEFFLSIHHNSNRVWVVSFFLPQFGLSQLGPSISIPDHFCVFLD